MSINDIIAFSDASGPGWQPRAIRLVVNAPVRYRWVKQQVWIPSSTVNVSRSGVLFTLADSVVPTAEVLIAIYLSRATVRVNGLLLKMPDFYCAGRVARVADQSDGRIALAMRVEHEWSGRSLAPSWFSSFSRLEDSLIVESDDRASTRGAS
jgi:hypothetical protein